MMNELSSTSFTNRTLSTPCDDAVNLGAAAVAAMLAGRGVDVGAGCGVAVAAAAMAGTVVLAGDAWLVVGAA